MPLSEYERRILDEMWADLPPLRVNPAVRAQIAGTRGARRTAAWLGRAFAYLVVLCAGIGMVVFAGLLFHDGYAAATAAASAGAAGFLLGAIHRRRATPAADRPRRVGYLRAEREANREQ